MATATDDGTVDFAAIDAEVARGKAADTAVEPTTVVIETETQPAEAVAATKEVLKPEEGIQKLQKQLDEARAELSASQQRERETANREAEARGRVQSTELDPVKGAIERVKQAGDVFETKYAEAMAAQDWAAAAKVQREMASNATELATLNSGRIHLEKAPKPTPTPPTDAVEAWVADIPENCPRSRAWVRAHPDFARDDKKSKQMVAAHNLAVARGFAVESDMYFSDIEKTLGIAPAATSTTQNGADAGADVDATIDAAQPGTKGRQVNGHGAPAAAPVTRSGGAPRKGTITLTPAQ